MNRDLVSYTGSMDLETTELSNSILKSHAQASTGSQNGRKRKRVQVETCSTEPGYTVEVWSASFKLVCQ